jgi:hypothetical protein
MSEAKLDNEAHGKSQDGTNAKERVALSRNAMDRIDAWVSQLRAFSPVVSIKRAELVEWVVSSHDESLSSAELKNLAKAFYNEERVLRQALNALREAKTKGEPLDVLGYLQSAKAGQVVVLSSTGNATPLKERKRRVSKNVPLSADKSSTEIIENFAPKTDAKDASFR